jgi:hypothetical protein
VTGFLLESSVKGRKERFEFLLDGKELKLVKKFVSLPGLFKGRPGPDRRTGENRDLPPAWKEELIKKSPRIPERSIQMKVMFEPDGIAFVSDGTVFFKDTGHIGTIRKISLVTETDVVLRSLEAEKKD